MAHIKKSTLSLNMQNSPPSPAPRLIAGVVFFAALLIVWLSKSGVEDDEPLRPTPTSPLRTQTYPANEIVQGSLRSIPYYHCAADKASVEASQIKDVVLLHGSRFTKEDWKTSKILGLLCKYNQISVTAFDLEVRADYKTLIPLMKSMPKENIASQVPVAALVTPSASGYSVVSGIADGKVAQLQQVIGTWVPIAAGTVSKLQNPQLNELKDSEMAVWAIYGDQDVGGKQVSTRLGDQAGASVKEFPGGHPFYLSIPDEFVAALVQKLGVEN